MTHAKSAVDSSHPSPNELPSIRKRRNGDGIVHFESLGHGRPTRPAAALELRVRPIPKSVVLFRRRRAAIRVAARSRSGASGDGILVQLLCQMPSAATTRSSSSSRGGRGSISGSIRGSAVGGRRRTIGTAAAVARASRFAAGLPFFSRLVQWRARHCRERHRRAARHSGCVCLRRHHAVHRPSAAASRSEPVLERLL